MTKDKKIIFYYHHFGGYGHGMRIYSLCKALQSIGRFNILVINSGRKQPELQIARYAKVLNLPALYAKDSLFNGVASDGNLKSTFAQRQAILKKIVEVFKPNLAVIEHFPFGRFNLEDEILAFIKDLKTHNCKLYASVRDLILSNGEKEYFDLFNAIFIHEDEKYNHSTNIPLNAVFTGRVHPYDDLTPVNRLKIKDKFNIGTEKLIVASIGGGLDGHELIEKLIGIKTEIDKKYLSIFLIYTGNSITDGPWVQLNQNLPANCHLIKFDDELMNHIYAADLFISMGGYNSINSHLICDTPSMVFPRLSDIEQSTRAKNFGFTCYNYEKMTDNDLLWLVLEKLSTGFEAKYSTVLTGALTTARIIAKALELKRAKIRVKTRCNLVCAMCSWKDLEEQLEEKRIRALLDELAMFSVQVVNFTGGEPTTYPGLERVIAYAKSKGFKVSLSTNAFNLKPLQRIVKNLDYIDISIDSPNEELNDRIRGREGSFSRALKSIEYLSEQGLKPHINATVRPDNYKGIHKLIHLLHHQISSISFTLVDTTANGMKELKFDYNSLEAYYFDEVITILKESVKHSLPIRITPYFDELEGLNSVQVLSKILDSKDQYLERLPEIFTLYGKPCLIAKDQIRINANGNVRPCCYLDDEQIHFGNINNTSLKEVVVSNKYFTHVLEAKEGVGPCSVCQQGYTGYKTLCLSKV